MALVISGCFSDEPTPKSVTLTSSEVTSLLPREVIQFEKNLELSGRLPHHYESDYQKPHLVRLHEASVFFREKVSELEQAHTKKMISLDRKILDAKKAEIDAGIISESPKTTLLRELVREKNISESEHKKGVKMLKRKERERIQFLNEQYLSVLKSDFSS
ncbi:hypothetical protein [Photobacterium galatheae]|nr:hypothetical protein [Photobacterium galatheae]MCM0149107.1 hypothetical protein [Photobacterium galatheae]